MTIPNADEIARIAAALVSAMSEARVMADAGSFGPSLEKLLQHARKLHQLIGEELAVAGGAVGEHAGGLYTAMDDKLRELEALLRQDVQRH